MKEFRVYRPHVRPAADELRTAAEYLGIRSTEPPSEAWLQKCALSKAGCLEGRPPEGRPLEGRPRFFQKCQLRRRAGPPENRVAVRKASPFRDDVAVRHGVSDVVLDDRG